MQRAGTIATASGDPALIADVACNTVETELMRDRIDLAQAQLATGQQAPAQMQRPDLGTMSRACKRKPISRASKATSTWRSPASAKRSSAPERAGRTRGNIYPKLLAFLGAVQQQSGDLVASYDTLKKEQRLTERMGRTETADYLG